MQSSIRTGSHLHSFNNDVKIPKKDDKQVPICEHHKETPTEIICEFIYRGETPQMCAFSTPAVTGFILCSCFYNNQLPFKIK